MGARGSPDGPRAAWFDARVRLRDHLAEAIDSIRTQAAVTPSLATDHVSGAGDIGPQAESTPDSQPG
jgi:hypothetical protein